MITTIRANLWPRPAGWLPIGTAELRPMRRLDRAIHAAIESFVGWDQMPAAVLARPLDPTRCVVAAEAADAYVGQLGRPHDEAPVRVLKFVGSVGCADDPSGSGVA